MDSTEFRQFGKAVIDYLADYTENIRSRRVLPSVEPGYLQKIIPTSTPENSENWKDVLRDIEEIIMPGITHWNSPHFHAYFPTGNSYPGIVGELLSAGIGCIGFSWIASPACTELEVIVMDWLGRLLHLPEFFLNSADGPGGGVIQGSASEATFVCLLAAKERTLRRIKAEHQDWDEGTIKGKMIAYSSDQSNSSVEKSGLLGSMTMKLLKSDENGRLRGETLLKAVEEDLANGYIPSYVCATLGTTGTCAFDRIDELGPICQKHNIWLHIDAAYAGSAFICPEYKHLMAGVDLADSFNFNPHKWLLVNFDCSALWVKDSSLLVDAFNVDRIYLKHQKQGVATAPDYRHWQIPLGRRFRALKLWLTLRLYGAEKLRAHIRKQISLSKMFESFISSDGNFEIPVEPSMGLVCFRLKGPDSLTKRLLHRLTSRKNIYVIAGSFHDIFVIRFVVCSRLTEEKDVRFAWQEINSQSHIVLTTADDNDLLSIESKEFPPTFNKNIEVNTPIIDYVKEKEDLLSRLLNNFDTSGKIELMDV